jgi:hypothetical protein
MGERSEWLAGGLWVRDAAGRILGWVAAPTGRPLLGPGAATVLLRRDPAADTPALTPCQLPV